MQGKPAVTALFGGSLTQLCTVHSLLSKLTGTREALAEPCSAARGAA